MRRLTDPQLRIPPAKVLFGAIAVAAAITRTARADPILTTLASFTGTNGAAPADPLILDSAGNLFGTTKFDNSPYGTAFELAAGSGTISTLAHLSATTGATPVGGLLADTAGNLYGTTSASGSGGATANGVLFQVAAGTDALTPLATLPAASYSGVIADASGNLYGTTKAVGMTGFGAVFKFSANTHALSTMASFAGSSYAGLTIDKSGNLFGTTFNGGANGQGSVFEVAAETGALTTVASFNGSNGANPGASVYVDPAGNIYGTTQQGGASNDGVVFRIAAGSNTAVAIATFNGANGSISVSGLTADAAGNLYGTTHDGGTNNDGTVFRVDAATNALTTLASFGSPNGASPGAGLVADAVGNLYGTTMSGGTNNDGTVYELSNSGFVVAAAPEPTSLLLLVASTAPLSLGRRRRRH